MRYLLGLMCVVAALLALPVRTSAQAGEGATTSKQASAALMVHARRPLLAMLVLPVSYYYVDVDPLGAGPTSASEKTPTEESQKTKQRKRGVAIGVGVALAVVGLVAVGVSVAVSNNICISNC